MPEPTVRKETFLLIEPIDMFEKLVWEHQAMRLAYLKPQREQTYMALNAAMTAWHMCDWLCAAFQRAHYKRLSEHFERPIDNCKVFRRFALEHTSLKLCESLAVAAKHFTFDAERIRVSTRFQSLPNSMEVPIIEDGESSMPAPLVISMALRFWADTLWISGLATESEIAARIQRVEQP